VPSQSRRNGGVFRKWRNIHTGYSSDSFIGHKKLLEMGQSDHSKATLAGGDVFKNVFTRGGQRTMPLLAIF
jgi:hypothetical protein